MRLVVTGGGTGGHIYPAVEVAKEMARTVPSSSILYIGTGASMEATIVPREGLDFRTVRSSGVVGKSPVDAARGILQAVLGVADARRHLASFKPDVVLGTGGYASGPVVMAARLMGIPTAVQEQNAVPGKTNQWLGRVSDAIFAAWEGSQRFFPPKARVFVTGNPVRKELLESNVTKSQAREYYGIPNQVPVILVLGGSRGAKVLADTGLKMAKADLGEVHVILIAGEAQYRSTVSAMETQPLIGIPGVRSGNIIVRAYEHNMAMAYAAADLVVGRAGGLTLSEVTALGLPSIIVPSPNVSLNHQEPNARALEAAGAALVIIEKDDAPTAVADAALSLVKDPRKLESMRASALRLGKPNASADICRGLIAIARRRIPS